MLTWLWLIISGLVSGVVAGMGMGGGTLLIPILTIFFKFNQQLAQGINLVVFLPSAIVAIIIHCKNKLVSFKSGLPLVLGGVAFAVPASLLAINISSLLLKRLFGGFLLAVGVWQIVSSFMLNRKSNKVVYSHMIFVKH